MLLSLFVNMTSTLVLLELFVHMTSTLVLLELFVHMTSTRDMKVLSDWCHMPTSGDYDNNNIIIAVI